jgi:hypothetical protein
MSAGSITVLDTTSVSVQDYIAVKVHGQAPSKVAEARGTAPATVSRNVGNVQAKVDAGTHVLPSDLPDGTDAPASWADVVKADGVAQEGTDPDMIEAIARMIRDASGALTPRVNAVRRALDALQEAMRGANTVTVDRMADAVGVDAARMREVATDLGLLGADVPVYIDQALTAHAARPTAEDAPDEEDAPDDDTEDTPDDDTEDTPDA